MSEPALPTSAATSPAAPTHPSFPPPAQFSGVRVFPDEPRLPTPSTTGAPDDRWQEIRQHWRGWLRLTAPGWVVLVLGAMEVAAGYQQSPLQVLLVAVAAGLYRLAPGWALTGLWVALASMGVLGSAPVAVSLIAMAVVAYGTARFGSRAVVVYSALSMLVLVCIPTVVWWVIQNPSVVSSLPGMQDRNWDLIPMPAAMGVVGGSLLALLLVLPWTVGLCVRLVTRAKRRQAVAEEQAAEATTLRSHAEQIAALRAGQAQLARDVHDVVGHSLAVILAQAESAQYLRDDEVPQMREVLTNVADSARKSLQDVRQVLTESATPRSATLEAIIEGCRGTGSEIDATVVGTPAPLPPELEQVAGLVLQEMLTNAIKHGRASSLITVEQRWATDWRDDELRLRVRNFIAAPGETETGSGGMGLGSIRHRLASVGGRFETDLDRLDPDASVFTATAWIPLRANAAASEASE